MPIREGRDDDHRRKACRRAQPRGKHRGDRLESVCGPMHRLRLHGVAVVRWPIGEFQRPETFKMGYCGLARRVGG